MEKLKNLIYYFAIFLMLAPGFVYLFSVIAEQLHITPVLETLLSNFLTSELFPKLVMAILGIAAIEIFFRKFIED